MTEEVILKMAAVAAVRARVPRLAIVTRRSIALVGDKRLSFRGQPMHLLYRKRYRLIDQQDDGQRNDENSGDSTHGRILSYRPEPNKDAD